MQTFMLAVALGAAAAATIPQEQSRLTTVKSTASEVYQLGNISSSASAEWIDSNATYSQTEHIHSKTIDPPSPLQNNQTHKYSEEPLNQSTPVEVRTVDGDYSSQSVVTKSRHNGLQFNNSSVFEGAPQVEFVQEEASVPSQAPMSDNSQDASPSSIGISESTSGRPSEPLNLPSGASFMLGTISTTFSCFDRPYGYYADPDIHCRVFHVCNPSVFSDGTVLTQQYSFMCGEGTVFDQRKMTCMREWEAAPCSEAPSFYLRNQEFGQMKEPRP